MARIRNTKALAQRIEREYFKRRFFIPQWRVYLSVILAGLGVCWLGWRALAHDQGAFTSGPVSPRHASFGRNCASCHDLKSPFSSKISNRACLTCHDGPVHQEQQTSTPGCIDCHVEHKGSDELMGAGAGDRVCVNCHSNLKSKDGKITVAARIESISKGHPEFIPLRAGHSDPGGVKFNHKVHLRRDLKAPGGTVQLECIDCHRQAGIVQPWQYGREDPAGAPKLTLPALQARASMRAYMQPINYYRHCSSCHPLHFDQRFATTVPHKKPEAVEGVLEPAFRTYIAAHPEELRTSPEPLRITRSKSTAPPRTAEGWISQRVGESKRLLWTKTCAECHTLSGLDTLPTPKIREVNITARWLQHGSFDHSPHKMLDCTSCHKQVRNSELTSDVLVPGIRACETCHSSKATEGSARFNCSECHQYHNWSKERPSHGGLMAEGR